MGMRALHAHSHARASLTASLCSAHVTALQAASETQPGRGQVRGGADKDVCSLDPDLVLAVLASSTERLTCQIFRMDN